MSKQPGNPLDQFFDQLLENGQKDCVPSCSLPPVKVHASRGFSAPRAAMKLDGNLDGSVTLPPRFSSGQPITALDNQGRTRTGTVCGTIWQEPGTGYRAGWWYWLESEYMDSWTHESRISQRPSTKDHA